MTYYKDWYNKNKERERERSRKYYQNNKNKFNKSNLISLLKREIRRNNITETEIQNIINEELHKGK